MKVRRIVYRAAWKITYPVGVIQSWLADGINRGSFIERLLIVPIWFPFRMLYLGQYWIVVRLYGDGTKLDR